MDMKLSSQIEKLQLLLGDWTGVTKTWFEPGKAPVEGKIKGKFAPGVNENFIMYTYESMMDGKSFQGFCLYGYYSEKEVFQGAWVDSFHMGGSIMFSEGKATEKGFSILGSYVYSTISWGWRTEIEILNDNEIVITSYNISPEGQEDKATETTYTRVK